MVSHQMAVPLCSPKDPSHISARTCSQMASLLYLSLDIMDTAREEYLYIWRAANTLAKYLFLTARYLALFSLIVYFIARHYYWGCPTTYGECMALSIAETMIVGVQMLILEILLMLRIYGLYCRKTKVAVVLGLMLLAKIILCSTTRLYAGSFVMLNGNCELPNAPSVVLFLGIFCLVNLAILLSIIQIKCKTLGSHPIYQIIARDTAGVLCILLLCGAIGLPGAAMNKKYTHLLPGPTVVGLSVTTCRLILNTRASSSTREEEMSSVVDIHIE
ncbi:hypothetical protein F5887DRAFT_500059 [Amanita rubescens]|nr:hypothetical protein F5887DRAFT_500059 [Amanita rubescens]